MRGKQFRLFYNLNQVTCNVYPTGRLLSLLRAARGVLSGLHHTPSSRQPVMPLSPRRLTGFALDIARGMEYIAEKKV